MKSRRGEEWTPVGTQQDHLPMRAAGGHHGYGSILNLDFDSLPASDYRICHLSSMLMYYLVHSHCRQGLTLRSTPGMLERYPIFNIATSTCQPPNPVYSEERTDASFAGAQIRHLRGTRDTFLIKRAVQEANSLPIQAVDAHWFNG